MNETDSKQTVDLVFRRLTEPIHLGGQEVSPFLWLALLIPILIVGKVYIIWMYRRDARTIGWVWASLLSMLRLSVYYILAAVFLLPALQTWEETKNQSRVVVVLDGSQSMTQTRDDLPSDDTPPDKLPTRQEKVVRLLTDGQPTFLDRFVAKNPVFAYRFGKSVDEDFHVLTPEGHWTRKDWEEHARRARKQQGPQQPKAEDQGEAPEPKPTPWDLAAWVKPDPKAVMPDDLPNDEAREAFRKDLEFKQRVFSGTNLGDSLLTVVNRELNNMVQGVVVITDGRSTEGTVQAFKDLAARAEKADIPIFVVCAGEERPQIKIDITDLRVPEQARPEDRFRVAVEVTGEGLTDKEVPVFLDVYKPNEQKPTATLRPKTPVKFNKAEPPRAQAEFEIEAGMFTPAKPDDKEKPKFDEGEWRFVARVPRDRREAFLKPEHVTDPATMRVVKRPLRVLLFAGGSMRDFQFVRTLFVRETDKKRAELSIYLQPAPGQEQRRPGIVMDVPPERFLTQFPFQLRDEGDVKEEDRLYNLNAYDVVVAFDPDWTRLTQDQLNKLEQWVDKHGGGLVVVAGPVNTIQLARPGANKDKLKPVLDLHPVVLEDARIQELERTTADPWKLNFPGATPEMEFLKLDEENPQGSQMGGWEQFFYGDTSKLEANRPLQRGFYNYYPVKQPKDNALVIASFADPRARLGDGKEQPYLVTTTYGSGKVVWLSAGEFWRLRNYKEIYHERFWTKLARYAGAGNAAKLNRRVFLNMGKTFPANSYVTVEAQVYGRDMQPLPRNVKPRIVLTLPTGVSDKAVPTTYEMAPRGGQEGADKWEGYFTTRFLVKHPGEYKIEVKVEETGDSVANKFVVKESNPELDDTRPDFDTLYWLASDATKVLARIPDEDTQKQVRQALLASRPRLSGSPSDLGEREDGDKNKEGLRLYFELRNAEPIPGCMVTAQREQKNRGAIRDLWDQGPSAALPWVNLVLYLVNGLLAVVSLIVGVMAVVALARGKGAEIGFYLLFTLVLLVALVPLQWFLNHLGQPVMFSLVMVAVVMLLAVEWLTRKLLRLA